MVKHCVQVDWNNQSNLWWHETCAMVLQVFGLPGSRYTCKHHTEYMIFEFASDKDQKLCKILLSERL